MPEAGPGSSKTMRVSGGGTAECKASRVGPRAGGNGGVSQVAGDSGEYRATREVLRREDLGMERSDGARGGRISSAGTRAEGGGVEWQVIREPWVKYWPA
jgi:hypothetical protein